MKWNFPRQFCFLFLSSQFNSLATFLFENCCLFFFHFFSLFFIFFINYLFMWCTFFSATRALYESIRVERPKRTHNGMHLRLPMSAKMNWQTICDVRKRTFSVRLWFVFGKFVVDGGECSKARRGFVEGKWVLRVKLCMKLVVKLSNFTLSLLCLIFFPFFEQRRNFVLGHSSFIENDF